MNTLEAQHGHTGLEIFAWADDVLVLLPYDKRNNIPLLRDIQVILESAGLCASENKADFGSTKTKIIEFSLPRSPTPDLKIFVPGFGSINQVNELKFLGIIFDEKLSLKSQLQYVCDKTRACLFSLKSVAMTNYGVPASHFATIFNGAILPKLLYGLPVWSSVLNSTSALKRLTKIFRLAALMSVRVAPTTSNKVLYPLANMLPPALFVEKKS